MQEWDFYPLKDFFIKLWCSLPNPSNNDLIDTLNSPKKYNLKPVFDRMKKRYFFKWYMLFKFEILIRESWKV